MDSTFDTLKTKTWLKENRKQLDTELEDEMIKIADEAKIKKRREKEKEEKTKTKEIKDASKVV